MKTSLIASVLFIASAPFAYAQQTQELAPIDASVITEEVTVQQLSAETGLSPRHVRMVLGSRTDHADYRIVYAKKERQFRQALGEERYQDLLAGRPIPLYRQPSQSRYAAADAPRSGEKPQP